MKMELIMKENGLRKADLKKLNIIRKKFLTDNKGYFDFIKKYPIDSFQQYLDWYCAQSFKEFLKNYDAELYNRFISDES
jgi:hypothetical protein